MKKAKEETLCGCRVRCTGNNLRSGLEYIGDDFDTIEHCQLHASAPELLEALKTIAAVISGPPGWQAELAKTAIAKAEGKP